MLQRLMRRVYLFKERQGAGIGNVLTNSQSLFLQESLGNLRPNDEEDRERINSITQ